ncbi:chemotaxis protein CheA [Rhodobacteraceae bacterium D3-12]|nr:chemotaxis protein CheA [Rhodobacteraceae bacterium D3-12]
MNDLLDTFFQECDDLLEGLTSGLNDLENGSGDDETVHAMFRSVHSIKGGAGAFGLDGVVSFAHAMENTLDDMRSGKMAAQETVVTLLFSAADHLCDLVEAARDGTQTAEGFGASVLSDLKQLSRTANGGDAADEAAERMPEFVPLTLDLGGDLPALECEDGCAEVSDAGDALAGNTLTGERKRFVIRFRAFESTYATGNDPVLLFRALSGLGVLVVEPDLTLLHPWGEDDWRDPQLSWTLTLDLNDGLREAAIHEVFEFVEGNCDLSIVARDGGGAGMAQLPTLPDLPSPSDLAELTPLLSVSQSPEGSTDAVKPVAASAQISPPALGAEPQQEAPAAAASGPSDSGADGARQLASHQKPQAARSSTIRVDLQRVDRLINLVGELVIGEAMLRQSVTAQPQFSGSAIEEALGQLKQLSGAIQESVMAIRAQPVRSLFQRMSRILRETAREAGKQARLVTIGDAVEVDKTVTERLVEPLTHMVRNAIDHGLETPEMRRAAGKPERGDVTLKAAHRSGRVVITLSDDGAGINRPRVRESAEAKGLIRPEDELSDAEIDNLLFRPGFSTATEVSNLSGRGVGMDVVRSEIQALGGRVNLQSTPGQGTTLSISLPLTLAVLEGMVVMVEGEALVVPTLALRETLQPGQASIHDLCDGDLVLSMNGELIPIIDLGAALSYRRAPEDYGDCALLLIESDSGRRTALAVDRIMDQREVVIKGLEQNYGQVPGIAAATILGDGSIALIVDTDQMIAPPLQRMGNDLLSAAAITASLPTPDNSAIHGANASEGAGQNA